MVIWFIFLKLMPTKFVIYNYKWSSTITVAQTEDVYYPALSLIMW